MTLAAKLNAVTESVRGQIPADAFAAMESASRRLAASGLVDRALKAGGRMPDFELPDATGRLVRSIELRAKGPLLVSFYRGSWCPYCNLELKALQARLAEIEARGATLVAISPQTPDHSLSTAQKHGLRFPVLSDAGHRVARSFGLVFTLEENLKPLYKAFEIDLAGHNGDASFELPVPATYAVARDGTVLDAFVDADYRKRPEPEAIVHWLDAAGES